MKNSRNLSLFFSELCLRHYIKIDISFFLETLYMQSPWQLKVKPIETSPQDVLFLGGRKSLKSKGLWQQYHDFQLNS